MKNVLPVCPINEGEGEEAWLEGLDLLLEELKFDEELRFFSFHGGRAPKSLYRQAFSSLSR